MATWRPTDTRCPLDEQPVSLSKCRPCRFFRGATKPSKEAWTVLCNWPKAGSKVEMPDVPDAFRAAFDSASGG